MEEESSSASQMQTNDNFTREHTLFLIDLMRRHLEENGSDLPHTLAELNSRIKTGKGSKKHMWGAMARQLSDHFGQVFDPARVNRKWNTLVDAYKRIKDNKRSTGRGTIRFKFFNEMDALLGTNHDVEFPVIGTSEGIQIRMPIVNEGRQLHAGSQTSPSPERSTAPSTFFFSNTVSTVSTVTTPSTEGTPSTVTTPSTECTPSTVNTSRTSTPSTVNMRRQRFRPQHSELIELLRESEAANQRRHSELLGQMCQAQRSFDMLFLCILFLFYIHTCYT